MEKVLRLTEICDMAEDPDREKNKLMREEALPGEVHRIWAIQGDDPESRQPLPNWISDPIQTGLLSYTAAKHKWDDVIEGRKAKGWALTPVQQRKYDDWKKLNSELLLLYNTRTQSRVTHLRSTADIKHVRKHFFSLRVQLSTNAGELKVQAGKGAAKQLVLLETEPVAPIDPDVLHAGVDDSVLTALQAQDAQVDGDEDAGEHSDQDMGGEDAAEVECEQLDALLEAEQDHLEILAQSSDEEVEKVFALADPQKVKRVKAFCHREAFKKLEALGLTMIPVHRPGVYLSFHGTSRTWQAFYPNISSGLSFTFGGTTNRA